MFRNTSIKYKHASLSIFLLLILVVPIVTEARTVIRSANTVSIGQDQLIEGDFYTAANIINISGRIQEDLLAAGTEVNINGEIGEDVFIIGANVDVNGTVGDDLRIIGSNITIAEPVLGDVFVVGANIKILSTASIAGDLTVVGGSAEVSGTVEGRILGRIETLRVDSTVSGDVDVTTAALTLGDKANVAGNVEYVSTQQLVRSQSADVGGEVIRNDPIIRESGSSVTSFLLPLLVILFSVTLFYLLSRRLLQRVVNRSAVPGVRSVLIGGTVLILAPFAISILLLSMLGFFAGIILLMLYLLIINLAIITLPAVFAQYVYLSFDQNSTAVTLPKILVGTLLVGASALVPFVGPVILLGIFIITFGSIIDLLLRANK